MNKTILLASAAAFALCVGGASAAGHNPVAQGKTTHTAKFKNANRALTVLYDQNSDSQGYADISQNFESSFDAYDAQGADDFTVPKGESWKVSEVDVTGLYFGGGSGPARSENVTFYKAARKGKGPSKVVKEIDSAAGDDDGFGSFTIGLGKGAKLKHGHYYVSVQANMDFSAGGEWGWATRNTQVGDPAMWQNPNDGFVTGCTTWAPEAPCLGGTAGPDHMFTLRGKVK